MPSLDGGDDFVGVSGLGEGFGMLVMLDDEAVDGGLKVNDGVEDAAFEASFCENGEEAFHGIEPRA